MNFYNILQLNYISNTIKYNLKRNENYKWDRKINLISKSLCTKSLCSKLAVEADITLTLAALKRSEVLSFF